MKIKLPKKVKMAIEAQAADSVTSVHDVKIPPAPSSKLPSKTKTEASPFRQLLPIALCIISFATVLSILFVYMDTTEIRHQQFRLNMSKDYDLLGVSQDDPALIKYIRDIHMKKYPMTFMHSLAAPVEHLNFTTSHELTPMMARFISDLLNKKKKGVFFQSLTGSSDAMMTAPWLSETMGWGGVLVEPDPRKYFILRKQNAFRPDIQVIHACLSPTEFPKEVTLHHDDESEVQINSVMDEETEWFHSRVKCFPLYTLMLAVNQTSIDLLSLGCQGQELQILQTVPFEKVQINVISIHLSHYIEEEEMLVNIDEYVQSITKFLMSKSYRLVSSYKRNYIYHYGTRNSNNNNNNNINSSSSGKMKRAEAIPAIPIRLRLPVAQPSKTDSLTVKLNINDNTGNTIDYNNDNNNDNDGATSGVVNNDNDTDNGFIRSFNINHNSNQSNNRNNNMNNTQNNTLPIAYQPYPFGLFNPDANYNPNYFADAGNNNNNNNNNNGAVRKVNLGNVKSNINRSNNDQNNSRNNSNNNNNNGNFNYY